MTFNPTRAAAAVDLPVGTTQAQPTPAQALPGHALSAIQRSLWFLYQMQPALQGGFNIAFVARMRPGIEADRLRQALNRAAQRHAMLRTRIINCDGEPRQIAADAVNIEVTVSNAGSLDEPQLDALVHADRARPFDLSQAPLVRASLYRCDDNSAVLLLALDHLVCDAWSLWQLLDELAADLTGKLAAISGPALAAPSFGDHVARQAAWLSSAAGRRQFDHWRQELDQPIPELALPEDLRPTAEAAASSGKRQTLPLDLPDELSARLRSLAERHGSSMFAVLLAGFQLLLHRLTGQVDLAVGSPMPARGSEWAHTVGSFTNPVVLRAQLEDGMTVGDLLRQTHSRAWRALRNQHYPFAELVERLRPERGSTGQPYYRVLFVAQKARAAESTLGLLAHAKSVGEVPWADFQLSAFGTPQNNGGAGMDLLLEVAEVGDRLFTGMDYDCLRFKPQTIRRWQAQWEQLLDALTRGDDQLLSQIDGLPQAERQLVLQDWNSTTRELPLHRCVHQLIEQQARLQPQAAAVLDGEQRLSYGELNSRANRLAAHLRQLGVGPDVRVALCSPRGAAMLTALLAIWKAGGAYVPLDPGYPDDRIAHMLSDSGCRVVLSLGTRDRLQVSLPEQAICLDLHGDASAWVHQPDHDVEVPGLHARHLAYVIYTSGSTGLPKGVMVEHRSLVNYALDAAGWFKLRPQDVVLQQNSLNFDLSIEEIVPAWLAGAALAPSDELFGLQALQHRPTMVHLTAAHWHTLVGEWAGGGEQGRQQAHELLAAVRMVNVTGDALAPHMVQRWDQLKPAHTELINTYGPTEITVSCSAAYVTHDPQAQRVSIGKPFANARLYLLNAQQQPVPVGVVGELYIGGEGVARGYLNLPQLSAERFIPDPFTQAPQARMYRTGDLARWRPDGEVEFVGRNDFQVKVRGFRVELGEVEAALAAVPGVTEVVVIAKGEQAHEKRLVAYLTGSYEDEELKAHAREHLPAYMQPAVYVRLQSLPKTAGGKLDRKALPEPEAKPGETTQYDAPQGETEQAIAAVWCELLKLQQVGRHDNFFALGGHSLMAVQLVERLRRLGLSLTVRALFGQALTVAAQAQAASAAQDPATAQTQAPVPPNLIAPGTTAITPELLPLVQLSQQQIDAIVAQVPGGAANLQDIYPLTHAQQGILFHHQLQPEEDVYVETTLLACPDAQRLQRVLAALQQVVDRHDVLRTQIIWDGLYEPVQVVHRHAALAVQTLSAGGENTPGDPATRLRAMAATGGVAIDLSRPPLLRLLLAEEPATGRWLVLMAAHHIILDNVAQAVLLQELQTILSHAAAGGQPGALPLAPPRAYRDFVYQTRIRSQDATAADVFFSRMLGDIDEPSDAFGLNTAQGDRLHPQQVLQRLPRQLSLQLRQAARRHQVGIASLLHLGWALVMARASGTRAVVFGTVLLGRAQAAAEADRLIGMFINTLPLRVDVDERAAAQALRRLQSLLAELLQHEQASLGQAQRCSGVAADRVLFNSLFNYRFGDPREALRLADAGPQADFSLEHEQERSNYPLSLDVDDLGEDLQLLVQAPPAVGAARVFAQMQQALQSLADALETAPDTPLQHLQTLPEAERQLVLHAWNATTRELPLHRCVHQLIEQQARLQPQAAAVLDGEQRLSYGELNSRANRLAAHLRQLGVGPDVRVALCSPRGAAMLTALLAIWKAGGAYVPLDPGYPDDRIAHMLADSGCRVVLSLSTRDRLQASLPEQAICLDLQSDAAAWAHHPDHNVEVPGLHARHLAYVIYTSGSTGLPKGVMVEHRSLVNYALDAAGWFKLKPQDVVLQQNSLNFDLSIEEIVPAWLAGAALAPSEELFGLQALQHRPTMVHLTAAHWHTLVGEWAGGGEQGLLQAHELLAAVRMVNVTGDALAPHMVQRWDQLKPARTELINTYGPTEITVSCSAAYVKHDPQAQRVSIGKPFANARLYILNPQQQPVPVGVVGELYIGGEGVARGYLNLPQLSAERFISDPFTQTLQARMYRTGDLARWRPDGEVEFVGRNDFQVKVRGFRVELGEVEAALAAVPGVTEVVVIAKGDQAHEKRLVAYLTGGYEEEELKAHAREHLPAYMQPAAYVRLQSLPKTAGGKLDRKALPEPEAKPSETTQHEAPQGETEQAIAAVWCELLKQPQVGRHDNFFALGGHSLMAVQLVERLRRLGLRLTVRALFGQALTVAAQAQAASAAQDPAAAQTQAPVPPNLIAPGTTAITPELLPLVQLSQQQIDTIVAQVPGGAANVQDIYPLTHAQQGILFHHQLQPEEDVYVETTLLACPDAQRLQRVLAALQQVVDRHDVLRTQVIWDGLDEPLQVVHRRAALAVQTLSAGGEDTPGDPAARLRDMAATGGVAIDLARPPLLRLVLAEEPATGRWLVLMAAHHIILDNVAQAVLLQELREMLASADMQGAAALPAPRAYRDFVHHARKSQDAAAAEAFFSRLLHDVDEPTAAYGMTQAHGDGLQCTELRRLLPSALSLRLRQVARRQQVGIASLMHLAWALVMARASGNRAVVFGTVLLGRTELADQAERLIGLCINTLPLRVDVDQRPAAQALRELQSLLAELLQHEQTSLSEAQRCSGLPADRPLFNSLFNHRFGDIRQELHQESADFSVLQDQERSNYPLSLDVDDLGDDFSLTVQVDRALNPERVYAQMQQALQSLADALETAPDTPLQDLQTLPETERQLVLQDWNATAREMPLHRCVHQLIEQQARLQPQAPAVLDGKQRLSYGGLNSRANRLAAHLRQLGVGPDVRVALCSPRGAAMLTALLAIWKAGGAYVPLDPAYPDDRIAHMLADSGCRVVLSLGTRDRLQASLPEQAICLDLHSDQAAWAHQPSHDVEVPGLHARHLAYVIYTSGSTGLPKGVMVEHRSLVNYALDAAGWFKLKPQDVVLQQNSLNFDLSIEEIVPAWLAGAALAPSEELFGLQALQHRPTMVHLTAAHWHTLVGEWAGGGEQGLLQAHELLAAVRMVNVTGDALAPHMVQRWDQLKPAHTELINTYGPTEITVSCSAAYVKHDPQAQRVSIGKPFANARLYILNPQQQPVPVGVVGELYIGGDGVARGYLNLPKLSAERFIPDPFTQTPQARMYRTGDLARWRPDGEVEFVGRNDFQVKVRGFRVELGEVEAALAAVPGVTEVVVIAKGEQAHEKRLVAYLTGVYEDEQIKAHASQHLPAYMQPAAYVRLNSLPKTAGGKLDRKALPEPEAKPGEKTQHEGPQGETEQAIAAVWCELLKLPQVGRHDNFFALGGHSLMAVQLVERLRRQDVHISMRALFGAAPTVVTLAVAATQGGPKRQSPVVPPNPITPQTTRLTPELLPLVQLSQQQIDAIVAQVPGGAANVQDIYPLTHAQEGILFHHRLQPESDGYVDISLMACADEQALQTFISALDAAVQRHDALRTGFCWAGLEFPVQVVHRQAQVALERLVFDPADGDPAERLLALAAAGHWRMAVDQPALVRLVVTPDPAAQRVLVLMFMHHLIFDHVSQDVLLQEVQQLAMGQPLPPAVAFRDFVFQSRLAQNQAAAQAFFTRMLASVDQPATAYGLPPGPGDSREQPLLTKLLPADLCQRLRQQAQGAGVGLSSLLHLAWALVLAQAGARTDVVFGTVLLGRTQGMAGAERLVGMFINTLPLRVDVDQRPTLQALRALQDLLAELLEHEHASLSEASSLSGVRGGQALFNALFNYRQGDLTRDLSDTTAGMQVLQELEHPGYPLSLDVDDLGDDLSLTLQVHPDLNPERVYAQMQQALQSLADALETAPDTPLQDLQTLPEAERQLVLQDWNSTARELPLHRCVHQLIEQQVRLLPQAPAVLDGEQRLSYGELNSRANRLAAHLRQLGVGPDVRVALCSPRGAAMLTALLAIWKAGGAYVPLDPAYPDDRIAHMLADSGCRVVLSLGTRDRLQASLPEQAICLDLLSDAAAWAHHPDRDVEVPGLHARHLAYVIYTSGSTGLPKGVMVEHRSLVNYALDAAGWFKLKPQDVVLQQNSLNFDLSIEEIVPAWLAGAALAPSEELFGLQALQHRPTMVHLTAAHWHTLVGEWADGGEQGPLQAQELLSALRMVNVTGDALAPHMVQRWDQLKPAHTELINTYGPTEITVSCSAAYVKHDPQAQRVSIGKPFANARLYILNPQQQPVPVGVVGELYIGGEGVARGYLNLPQLSAERFIPDPFTQAPQARMYRTGDLARWRPDGEVEFVGRNDFQVKVRGFRVELGEVEAALAAVPGVTEVVVIAKGEQAHEKRLVAYLTGGYEDEQLSAHAREHLPAYMQPAAYLRLQSLPKTAGGKLDRKALPEPEAKPGESTQHEAPQGPTEETIAAVWCELLKLPQVGRHDNFFALGGHSLMAVQLVARLGQRLGATPDLARIYESGSLLEMAQVLEEALAGRVTRSVAEPCEGAQPEGQAQAFDPLVTLQQGVPGEAPVFCVPGAGQSVAVFAAWAQAQGRQRPVLGLQPRGLDGEQLPHATVQEAAEVALQALLQAQPDGKLHLMGHSFGGWVAFELALLMTRRGVPPLSLTLVDTDAPDQPGQPALEPTPLQVMMELQGLLGSDEPLPPDVLDFDAGLPHLHALAVQNGLLDRQSSPQTLLGPLQVLGAAMRCTYTPQQALAFPVHLVQLADPDLDASSDQALQQHLAQRWRAHANRLVVWQGPGAHHTVLQPPHVQDLAQWWLHTVAGGWQSRSAAD